MDSIYHEKQEGQLCAQHCLNNLLQGAYFDAVQLAEIAHTLDEAEKTHLASGGNISSTELLKIIEKPSSNMDDSGFFSVQVISEALKVWNLEIHPISSPRMKHVMANPVDEKAFICNHELHWFTIRKLGSQWFNLDSLKRNAEFITDTYLSLFLAQLQSDGYYIFVVTGNFPASEADELLTLVPYEQGNTQSQLYPIVTEEQQYESELAEAIALSLSESSHSELSEEELREKRIKRFEKL